MKKKTIIIAAIILVVLIAGLVIGIVNYTQYTRLFKDTNYPVSYKSKNGNIILTVKDKSNSDITWTATIEDPDYATAEIKGKASSKKMKCVISPVEAGITTLSLTKTADAAGIAVDKTRIDFPIYISETPEGLIIEFMDNGTLIEGNDVLGAGSDHPVILCGNYVPFETEDKLGILGNIDFVKGKGDWEVEPDEGLMIYLNESEDTDRVYAFLAYSDNTELIEDNASETDSQAESEEIIGTLIDPYTNSPASNATVTDASSTTDATTTDATTTEASITDASATNANSDTTVSDATAVDASNETSDDAPVEEVGSGVITLSSSSLGISVKKKVTFYSDGHMVFGPVEEQK